MSKLKEGMKVQFIEYGILFIAEIQTLNDDVAIVKTNDGELVKKHVEEIAILKESEPVDTEQPEEPKEDSIEIKVTLKDEITITRNDFVEKCGALCSKRHFEQSPGVASICSDFVVELMRELFTEFSKK